MADKRVTFKMGPIQMLDAEGKVMWEHHGQAWYDLPQAGGVYIQSLLVELENKLTQMGSIVAEGGTIEEQFGKAAAAGILPPGLMKKNR
jgi:hypothetical protein